MTLVSGADLVVTPCCGRLFRRPRYASFSWYPQEVWTDGRQTGWNTQPDLGLRRCACGAVFLLSDTDRQSDDAHSDMPCLDHVADAELEGVISTSHSESVERLARERWVMVLNDPYREVYRAYRDPINAKAERKPTVEPFRLRLWQMVFKTAKPYQLEPVQPEVSFTMPPYTLTDVQHANLVRLLELYEKMPVEARDNLRVADTYRTLGRFDEAAQAVAQSQADDNVALVICAMIERRETAPIRVRV